MSAEFTARVRDALFGDESVSLDGAVIVDAVLYLHRTSEHGDCTECSLGTADDVPAPCRTVLTIAARLGVE